MHIKKTLQKQGYHHRKLWDQIEQFRIANYESFLKRSHLRTIRLQLFHKPFITHVSKYIYWVLEINKATTKTTTKTWFAKVVAFFIHRTNLFHRTILLGLFFIPKQKKSIFLVCTILLLFWFLLSICFLNDFPFLYYKEQQEQQRCTNEREKQINYCVRKHAIWFVCLKQIY